MSPKIRIIAVLIATTLLISCGKNAGVQIENPPIVQEIQIVQPIERSITVSGAGKVEIKPDTMEFVIKIENSQKELVPAKEENNAIKQKVMAVLEKHKIAKEDIKSDFTKINTDASSIRVYRYIVTNSIKVKLRDLTKIEAVFTGILEAGANQITDISFQVTNLEQYKERAAVLALQITKQKASVMAGELGQVIGKPISVQESSISDRYPYPYQQSFVLEGLSLDYVFDEINAVAFGEVTIEALITVKFELK